MSYTEYKVRVYKDGTEKWFNQDGQYHREDGPAYIRADGYKAWYKNGDFHRENGPAVVWPTGSQEWFKDGKRHREDGPAKIWPIGFKQWFLNGIEYSEQEFHKELAKRSGPCNGKFVEIDGKKYQLSLVD